MKTKLFIAAFALAFTCTITSCGNKKTETAPAPETAVTDSTKAVADTAKSVKADTVKAASVEKAAKPANKK
ncbi:hypothetical protein SAMN05444405_103216 [Bacteroides luti]|jgi:hypothetical protein|uniref:Lipoprotein n=1 Tax=Bacteroides luti TaxID=1297750 RepID=A0A1M4WZL6_9BACE|nr:hypothetical protein [Bacteroides luti]SHE86650.1 hypothetical protein SAMN05444405_103216 [Bacteroides luti]